MFTTKYQTLPQRRKPHYANNKMRLFNNNNKSINYLSEKTTAN